MVLPVRLCLEGANDCSQETTFAHTVDISAVGAQLGDSVYRSSPVKSLRCSDSTIKAGFALYGQSRLAPLSCGRVLSGL
jgi:hypothetical protein